MEQVAGGWLSLLWKQSARYSARHFGGGCCLAIAELRVVLTGSRSLQSRQSHGSLTTRFLGMINKEQTAIQIALSFQI